MRDLVGELRTRISEYEAHNAAANREFEEILALARQVHAGCQKTEPLLLSAAEAAGVGEQARHGQLIQALAQVDRIKPSPNRGGLVPWIVTHLDVTRGRARSIALAARQIGAVPELAALLSTGRIGTETVRVLTRAACAVKDTSRDEIEIVTATHELARREGIAAANRYVRSLEEIADPASPPGSSPSSASAASRASSRSKTECAGLKPYSTRSAPPLCVLRSTYAFPPTCKPDGMSAPNRRQGMVRRASNYFKPKLSQDLRRRTSRRTRRGGRLPRSLSSRRCHGRTPPPMPTLQLNRAFLPNAPRSATKTDSAPR
jgi:hypothetical protein